VSEPLGVWLIGARGAVATTTIAGAAAIRAGMIGLTGLVTCREPLGTAAMRPLDAMRFGGHDPRGAALAEVAMARAANR